MKQTYADALVEAVPQRRATWVSKYCIVEGCDRIAEPRAALCLDCQLSGVETQDRRVIHDESEDLEVMLAQWDQEKFPGRLGIDSDRVEQMLCWLIAVNRDNPMLRDVLLDALYVVRRRVVVWKKWLETAPIRHVEISP